MLPVRSQEKMKKKIIIVFIIILLIPIGVLFTESKFLDYILSFYPGGWKEKAVQISNWTDSLAVFFVILIAIKWSFGIYYKNKEKNENKVGRAN
jgi:uncharacterized membrane protein